MLTEIDGLNWTFGTAWIGTLGQQAARSSRLPLSPNGAHGRTSVSSKAVGALYAVAMVAVVVGVDLLFFRHQFWERLAVNIGIVLVFAAFYFRFLNRS